jgi:hypothetical protein
MLSAEIISAFIKWSCWSKPGLNDLFYFIVEALEGKKISHLRAKGKSYDIAKNWTWNFLVSI